MRSEKKAGWVWQRYIFIFPPAREGRKQNREKNCAQYRTVVNGTFRYERRGLVVKLFGREGNGFWGLEQRYYLKRGKGI